MNMKEAKAMRAAIVAGSQSLDDKTASTVPKLFPVLTGSGQAVSAGTRINWKGQVKRAAVTLWDREDQNPDNAADLWEDLDFVDGIRKITDVITAGLAFALGELGWRNGQIWESLIDGNVWTPEEFDAGWIKRK